MMADNLDGIPSEEIEADLKVKDSAISKAYQKGKARAQFSIDSKLLQLAQSGDLDALKAYERRIREIESTHLPPSEDVL